MPDLYHHERLYRGADLLARLEATSVTLCGAGALGSLLADNLSRQGIRRWKVIDRDRVEEHNAGTQLYGQSDVGARKVEALRGLLISDLRAAFVGDPAARNFPEILIGYPGMTAIIHHRLAHILHRLDARLVARLVAEIAHARTGIDMHPGASIGSGFFIDHGTGVVIGETTRIGEGVKLYQGVTLGALSFPRDEKTGQIVRDAKRHPTIGDGVVIYANATILGGETIIGHHSVIGSSAWVTRSIAPYTIVTIESPRLRFRESNNDGTDSEYLQRLNYQI